MMRPVNDQSQVAPGTLSLTNGDGFEVRVHAQGAAITSIRVPAPEGDVETVLDYPTTALRASDPYFLGVTAGRYANRLARARLTLDGETHELTRTPGQLGHTLHGGAEGFSHRLWIMAPAPDGRSVQFDLLSPAGDQGFPGALEATVHYALLDGWRLRIAYRASCDAPTVVNLANHAYFNLNRDDALATDHRLWVNADRYTPIGEGMIPTGEVAPVQGTPLDLREPVVLGERQQEAHEQLRLASGFDHNYVLNAVPDGIGLAAILEAPRTGLALKLHTTQPGLQCYGGQHLAAPFAPGQGICLEAQRFPDAPNQPAFPITTLQPGEVYEAVTIYEFCLR